MVSVDLEVKNQIAVVHFLAEAHVGSEFIEHTNTLNSNFVWNSECTGDEATSSPDIAFEFDIS